MRASQSDRMSITWYCTPCTVLYCIGAWYGILKLLSFVTFGSRSVGWIRKIIKSELMKSNRIGGDVVS